MMGFSFKHSPRYYYTSSILFPWAVIEKMSIFTKDISEIQESKDGKKSLLTVIYLQHGD